MVQIKDCAILKLMTVTQESGYIFLQSLADEIQKTQVNFALVALPGFGVTFYTKHLVANNQDIALITSSNQALNKINILDFDLYLDQGQIKIIDNI